MTRRSTFRGSPAQSRSRVLYWTGVAGNLICCLAFAGGLIFCLSLVADHLG